MSGASVAAGVRERGRLRAWALAEQARFAPWSAVLVGAGVLLYFALRREPAAWSGVAALGLSAGLCAALWRSAAGRGAGIALLAVSAGFLAGQAATWRALPIEALPRRAVVITARVEAVEALPEGRRLVLGAVQTAPDEAPLARTFRMKLRAGETQDLEAGDQVRVRALLRAPMPPAYPGIMEQTPPQRTCIQRSFYIHPWPKGSPAPNEWGR